MALTNAALYELSEYIRINTIMQKYAFRASQMKSGEKTIHQVNDSSLTMLSTLNVNKTVNIVKHTKAVQISNTVSPSQSKSSRNWKNI